MKYKKGNMKKAINKIDNASGITLVALVITVILLLILAAVTINLVLGDNGLIKTAKDVSKNYVNAANNEDEQISEFINTMNNIISGGTGEEGIGAQNKVIIGEVVWNENTHTASVTISKSAGTESGIQMQYQINNETGVWTTVGTQSITISDLKHNDVVYARLLKGSGVVNRAKKNIRDTIPPEVGITITNIGSNSMTASVTAQDKQYGMPNTPTYTFEIKETGEADSQYTQRQTVTTTTCSFTGLKKETNYTVRVTTSDKAGNSKSVTATKSTNAVEIATGNISFGSTLWNKTTHTASINITTETELQIQYKTSGSPKEETGWSTPGTSPVTAPNLTHNQTIYARLWDGNNAGDYASYTIKDNIDPQNAQISSWETTDITVATSATVKLLLIDNESGVNVGNSKWTLHTSSDPLGTSASDYDNTFTGTSTEPEITISKQETGTYYLHVLTVDNAGRTKETVFTEKPITVKKLITGITLSSDTNEVNVGETITITKTITPSDATNPSVTWTSSDKTVATVDENGVVTGVKAGTTTITATAVDGSGVSGSYDITVKQGIVPLASAVNVGDYVAYDPTVGVSSANQSKLSYTSPKGTGTSHGNGSAEKTFTAAPNDGSDESVKWRVLSKDTSTGEVMLISANLQYSMSLYGAVGYLYAEQELNSACAIYGYGFGANTSKSMSYYKIGSTIDGTTSGRITGTGARSLSEQDLLDITGYTPAADEDESLYHYGTSYTVNIRYPTNKTSTGLTAAAANKTVKRTVYDMSKITNLIPTESVLYDMIFNVKYIITNKYGGYWFSGRSEASYGNTYSGGVYFQNAFVSCNEKDRYISPTDLVYSIQAGTVNEYTKSEGIRPVVYLKTTLKTTGKNADGAWTITE